MTLRPSNAVDGVELFGRHRCQARLMATRFLPEWQEADGCQVVPGRLDVDWNEGDLPTCQLANRRGVPPQSWQVGKSRAVCDGQVGADLPYSPVSHRHLGCVFEVYRVISELP